MSKEIFQKMAKLEERLNWTVHPTDPVLPPYGELTKVCGVIERINVEKQENYFSQEDYRVAEYEVNRNALLNRIAAVASFFSGQVAMLANAGKNNEVKVETTGYFIHIQISGVVYRGWAGACPFQPGEEVELAVEWQDDHYELYAIARPKDKMISVCPTCSQGRVPYITKLFKEFFIFSFTFYIFLFILSLLFGRPFYKYYSYNIAIMILYLIMLGGYVLSFFYNKQIMFNTNVKLAEKIFKTFDFNEPKKIDLQKMTKKRLKRIYKQTGIKPTKEDYEKKPIKYPFWWMLLNCYLYYYE